MSYQNKYNSPLRKWAKINNFIPEKGSGITHTCLDGGTYNIQILEWMNFLKNTLSQFVKGSSSLYVKQNNQQ